MELNEEVVKKSLDWLDSLVGNSNDSDIALLTYQLLGILYDTCEELTEKSKKWEQAYDCMDSACRELSDKCDRLTEENEYLKTQLTATEARYESRKESDLEEVLELRLNVEELTEENERLKQLLDYKCLYGYDGEVMEYCVQGPCPHYEIKKELVADTVRKMQERLKEYLDDFYNSGEDALLDVPDLIDQIAKEMLEGV